MSDRIERPTPIILCGGLGSRLRPVVQDVPKPLAPICGRPFLDLVLEDYVRQGWEVVCLALGYLGAQIRARYGSCLEGMDILYSIEGEQLGTGGAVRLAHSALEAPHYLIANGDSFLEVEHKALLEFWRDNRSDIVMAVTRVNDASRYGTVDFSPCTRVITRFVEKGGEAREGWINGGVGILPGEILDLFPLGSPFSLEKDLFEPTVRGKKPGMLAYPCENGVFIDIGTPDSYADAQGVLSDRASLRLPSASN